MQVSLCILLLLSGAAASRDADAANPMGKAIQLIDELKAKITAEGEAEAKAYAEFVEWCDDVSKNTQFEIKTASAKKEKLTATIAKAKGDGEAAVDKIEELAGGIQTAEKDLKDATGIREKESSEFAASEAALVDTLDTLGRAISTLSKEMAKSGAAFAQVDTTNLNNMVKSMGAIIDAASFMGADKQKIVALVQSQSDSDDDDMAAPAAANYKSKSGNIVDVLEDMKDKAEDQLASLRKAETDAKHNFAMLKQSLEDQLSADNKDMAEQKSLKAASEETKATAEGELATTVKDLANANEALQTANANCMTTAADHESTMAARAEELKVIDTAKKILTETSGGAVSQSYSLLQLKTRTDLANSEVVALVKKLSNEHKSPALAQLASRIAAVLRMGSSAGDDVFGKIKGLISDMITKLQKEAEADATEKAYCDEQMAKTKAKKEELADDVEALSTKIDQASSKSTDLKEEVKEIQAELAKLASQQSEMDKIRAEQNAAYTQAKGELEQGLSGVRRALGVLREYYGGAALLQQSESGDVASMMQQPSVPEHSQATGAGQSIISILQVCESDFAKDLAAEEAEESDSASEYEKMTQENAVTKITKDQDVKYKTQEFKGLDKSLNELESDRATEQSELDAVNEYWDKINARCIAKPESYEERAKRRASEIAGLKEALTILSNEAAFMQRGKRGLRGGVIAA